MSQKEPQAAVNELELLDRVKRGDREAAERLVEVTYRTVYASLHRMCGGDSDLAADLTQETYRRAWGALSDFRGGSQVSTWLYRIAYTTFLNHVRRPARVVPMEEGRNYELRDPAPSAESKLAAAQEAALLREAVLELPDELRFTVSAHFWGGLDVNDIAGLEGITGAAVRKRLRKAFSLLALSLSEELS